MLDDAVKYLMHTNLILLYGTGLDIKNAIFWKQFDTRGLGVGGSGQTFSYVTSDMRPVPPGTYLLHSSQKSSMIYMGS